jgi:hypothetical protein
MSSSSRRRKTFLHEPLFSAPLGSPEKQDPKYDMDATHILRQKKAYMPSYRYEEEDITNIYKKHQQSYESVGRLLLTEHQYCENDAIIL